MGRVIYRPNQTEKKMVYIKYIGKQPRCHQSYQGNKYCFFSEDKRLNRKATIAKIPEDFFVKISEEHKGYFAIVSKDEYEKYLFPLVEEEIKEVPLIEKSIVNEKVEKRHYKKTMKAKNESSTTLK